MRIVHATPYFLPEVTGGIEVHVYELSRYLRKRGHEVTIYTCGHLPPIVDGIEVHGFSSLKPLPRIPNPFPSPGFFHKLSREHDVIHLHGQEFLTSFVGSVAAKSGGIPNVLTLHNWGEGFRRLLYIRVLRKTAYKTLFRFTINSADAVIAPRREILRTVRGLKPRILYQIPHGVAFERFEGIKSTSEHVLFLGRLVPAKGPEFLIRAVPSILKEVDTKFVIAGDGPQRRYLEALARKLKVNKYVRFLGRVTYERVPEILGKASIFVAPGDAGYSILEAVAARKPIVSANLEWNVSCVGKKSAIFVEPENAELLADATVRVLKDAELANELSQRARRFVERHRSWETIVDRYIEVYHRVLEG